MIEVKSELKKLLKSGKMNKYETAVLKETLKLYENVAEEISSSYRNVKEAEAKCSNLEREKEQLEKILVKRDEEISLLNEKITSSLLEKNKTITALRKNNIELKKENKKNSDKLNKLKETLALKKNKKEKKKKKDKKIKK